MIRLTYKRILSPTSINTYLDCPRKFYLRYIKKLKTKPSIYLVRGNIAHQVLQEFSKCWDGKRPENVPVLLLSLFDSGWQKAGPRLAKLGLPEKVLGAFKEQTRLMLIHFYFWLKRTSMWPPKRTEMRLVSKKLGLMGIVDAIHNQDGVPVVVDYKTSQRDELTSDIQRQAALYAALYQDFFNTPPEAVWIHFLAFDQDPKVIPVDDELINYARILTQSIHEKTISTAKTDYPCTCGGRCQKDFYKNET